MGAGIAGLAVATCLARDGWSVTVLERAAGPRGGAYVVGFSGLGYAAAAQLGLAEELRAHAAPWRELQQVDGSGRVLARMSESAQRAVTGRRTISVLRGDLESVLHAAARGIADIRFGTTFTALTPQADGVVVTLPDGSRLTADLLVGADGVHSSVRDFAFGPESRWRHDFGALVASYDVVDPPAPVREKTTLLTSVGRSAGLYPRRDGRLSAFFTFVADRDRSAERTSDRDSGRGAVGSLRRAYADLGWVWPDLIDHAAGADSVFFDDITQIRMPRWSRGRVVLVGDAAWAVSLLAGAGSSLAVGGALALSEHLSSAPDIATGLRDWERHLRGPVHVKQFLGRRTRHLFLPSTRLAVGMRVAALRLAGLPFPARRTRTFSPPRVDPTNVPGQDDQGNSGRALRERADRSELAEQTESDGRQDHADDQGDHAQDQ